MHTSSERRILPCLLPNYDHSPRSGRKALLLHQSTPKLWGKLLDGVFKQRSNKSEEENIIFIKSWNEWGEGNYL